MTDTTDTTDAAARRWVGTYEKAWASNDPDDIRALFTDDAEYRTEPWQEPWRGADEIVAGWLRHHDDPGTWTFSWDVSQAVGGRAYIEGTTVYPHDGAEGTPRVYSNLWVVDLVPDGRARSFTEWWMSRTTHS